MANATKTAEVATKTAEVATKTAEVATKTAEVTKKLPSASVSNVQFALSMNTEQFKKLPSATLRQNATAFAKSFDLAEKSAGLQAYYMRQIQLELADVNAKRPDGVKNIADFAEKYFGIGRSQSFNLARAGSFIVLDYDETEKRYIATDIWGKGFSNTALVRIAEFIGNDKDTAEIKRNEIDEKCRLNLISGTMSISELRKALDKKIIENPDGTKALEPDSNGNDNGNGNGNAKGKEDSKGNAKGKKGEKVIRFELSEKTALALKSELIKAMDNGAKSKEYPNITALINEMNEMFKEGKKK